MASAAKKPTDKVKEQAKPAAAKAPASKPAKAKPVAAKPAPVAETAPASKPAKAKPVAAKPAPVAETATASKPARAKPAAAAKTATGPAAAAPARPARKSAAKTFTGVPTSEAELLAMSDDDYMNEAQLAYFKAKLIAMREEILENARETGEHLKENEVFADPNDRATVEEENMLEQRVRDRERKLLKKINASLQRIDEGAYGYCLETGEPIGLPRLLARPTAELSIEAQEKHERLEKLFAD